MDSTLIYALILAGITPFYFILLYFFFKNSIVFRIGSLLGPLIVISYWANFFCGNKGMVHLFWGVPMVIAVIFITYYFIAKQIKDPILDLSNNMEDLSKGNLDANVNREVESRKDEVGKISHAFSIHVERLKEIISNIADSGNQLSKSSAELNKNSKTL